MCADNRFSAKCPGILFGSYRLCLCGDTSRLRRIQFGDVAQFDCGFGNHRTGRKNGGSAGLKQRFTVVGRDNAPDDNHQIATLALRVGASGLILSRLFQAAIHAGKRARSETAISAKPATVSSVAVHLIASQVRQLEDSQVLVIGAGEMAELAVEALRKRTVGGITVINRTVERAAALANRWSARSRSFEALEQELELADVVICSTAAPHPILNEGTVRSAMAHRPARPLIVMDIAFPRDVEESVSHIPGVHLYDLDKLEQGASRTAEERRSQVPQVEGIIAEEMRRFQEWLTTLEVRPVILAMREQAEAIRQREIDRTLKRLDKLGVDGTQEIESLTKSLVNKLLHEPTVRLKEHSQNGQGARYALLIRELFGLGQENEVDSP